jgi:hypothetical protein
MPDNSGSLIGTLSAVVMPIAVLVVAWSLGYVLLLMRSRREAQRTELQIKLLERVGSAREFGEFLNSAAGDRFLQALSPVDSRNRLFSSVQIGIFAIAFALILLAADFWVLLGSAGTNLRVLAIIVLAVGLASLASAGLSRRAARRLGIDDRTDTVVPSHR